MTEEVARQWAWNCLKPLLETTERDLIECVLDRVSCALRESFRMGQKRRGPGVEVPEDLRVREYPEI